MATVLCGLLFCHIPFSQAPRSKILVPLPVILTGILESVTFSGHDPAPVKAVEFRKKSRMVMMMMMMMMMFFSTDFIAWPGVDVTVG